MDLGWVDECACEDVDLVGLVVIGFGEESACSLFCG